MNKILSEVPVYCSPRWLKENLASVVPIDCSWYMPGSPRDPKKEYINNNIKGARFFDIDGCSDKTIPYPHMLPSSEQFSDYLTSLKISKNDHVVIYDASGVFTSCRLFWIFKIFGHEKVTLLNGGLPRWIEEGFETNKGEFDLITISKKPYISSEINSEMIKYYSEIISIVNEDTSQFQIFDARPHARFTGEAPESKKGISSGHMPHSRSLPFDQLLKPGNQSGSYKVLKSPEELNLLFEEMKIDFSRPIINTCGSGVTASILYFAMKYVRHVNEDEVPHNLEVNNSISVYDGSWSEYADQECSIILKG